ncbi:MAG TPA: hypothetical protein VNM48_03865 [Chloroflexota bacterium]|nr:hypothetical protein [Chloroflexota bacterium]
MAVIPFITAAYAARLRAATEDRTYVSLATVYDDTGATGNFDVVLLSNLPCRLMQVSRQPAATSSDRAEFAALRELRWGPDYVMPETAQVAVDGVLWNVVAGTVGAFPASGPLLYRQCDLRKAAG